MRGWVALTSGWVRPIQPEMPPPVRPPRKRVARERLLPPEVRKVLFDLDAIVRTANAEIRRVCEGRGLNKAQQAQQLKAIRKDQGK